MVPVIAIVGRPNVGKSTLFNALTKTRDAIVADLPGVTRDRQYGHGKVGEAPFIVIDTGGLEERELGVTELMVAQAQAAIAEADAILFLVDAKVGLTPADHSIANTLRQLQKPVWLVVNKTDGIDPDVAKGEFYKLGLQPTFSIAAAHHRGVTALIEAVLNDLNFPVLSSAETENAGISIAIVGRPNVGKSTLVNRILGEERVVVFDAPGTTRDSIFIPFERRGEQYTLIDTAGIRRRGRIEEAVEKFSVVKAMQAIEAANVVVLVINARENIVEQDLRLIGHILEKGRALVIAINKWDGMQEDEKNEVKRSLDRQLTFTDFSRKHFISALHGTGVGDLFSSIKEAYRSATCSLETHQLTEIILAATKAHQPPLINSRRIKLRYAHQGGRNPPRVIIHGTQAESVPDIYRRYLVNFFRKKLKLMGTPLVLEFKTSKNPFKGKKNILTERQRKKRSRLKQFINRKK